MTKLTTSLLALAAAGRAVLAQDDDVVEIDVTGDLATRRLLPDAYGYSIEPIWVDAFVSTPKAAKLLGAIGDITGKPPPIRVGGNTADQTYIYETLPSRPNATSAALPALPNANRLEITPAWFRRWGNYFPRGTELIFTLNFAANESRWDNAAAQAEAAWAELGENMTMFELGNEVDHFINKGWRDEDWGVDAYIAQWRDLTERITGSDWYRAADDPPKFQAGVFADPPWVPDQHDEIDDLSIRNLTHDGEGGIVERERDRDLIEAYAVHLYPQSTCDPLRWHRMRLDLLSNHTTLWLNVSQFVPEVAAADRAGAPLVMGETNSVSCGGRSGISDTFGAALWGVDYVLLDAAIGISKTYFHLGAQSEYSSFTPLDYEYKNESLKAGIRPGWYAHYFVAKVVAPTTAADGDDQEEAEELGVAAIPGANSTSLAGYAVYARHRTDDDDDDAHQELRKLVFLDMGVWNGTEGLSNPSTLSATDNDDAAFHSEGSRPSRRLRVSTPWCPGRGVAVTRLEGPGTNAKSEVAVSGVRFDPETGDSVGDEEEETITVGDGGVVEFEMERAHGVLLQVGNGSACGDGSGGSGVVEVSAAVAKSISASVGLAAVLFTGFALFV
ncbi:hypothetical protein DL764_010420 [Monosporascus ibericus]|uniref:Beta-glucuronidase C-terminal domain-containing protein n=1 Tax=Monosporascus ibericus TaxID=155417 RepID=A0A4Q4SRK7_9PEZI|nr:hypothetical protein DL764_010420 [Monosporascus ibericus]